MSDVVDTQVFGCTKRSETPDDHVEDLFASRQEDESSAVKKAVLEAQSKVSRPKLSLPQFMNDPQYRHGITSSKSDDAKQLLYATNNDDNTTNAENNFVAARHGPGQQRKRDYKWPKSVDPSSTTFGIKQSSGTGRGSSSGVADALCMQDDDSGARTECDASICDPDKLFGKSTSVPNSSTAECLLFHGSDAGDVNDDIGKSLTPGFRNASTSRCFGTPSIRTDIPKYDKRSVADTQSYGDDVNANYLLRPTLFSSFGLEEDEFVKPRSKDYLKRLFNSCGLNMEDDTFEEIYSQVSEGKNVASIESFQIAYEERQQILFPPDSRLLHSKSLR